ncbi:RING finger protein [Reticulomyxa filosa]|uniref:RING finger protein n=1 Tax=Reticulomyxa filosa TaxID=46433 RepID=X6P612_RETFI|nr:RING finger protein [Reticulomyxa filosa]|eukprot:ETO33950.1 RING finger protein [Reticulomyxa filosa]
MEEKYKKLQRFLETYKTQQCNIKGCPSSRRCPYYHKYEDYRRNPFEWGYTYHPCPKTYSGGQWKGQCDKKCPFAHSYYEVWFHPHTFRRYPCQLEKGQMGCPWKTHVVNLDNTTFENTCTHFHNENEKLKDDIFQMEHPRK